MGTQKLFRIGLNIDPGSTRVSRTEIDGDGQVGGYMRRRMEKADRSLKGIGIANRRACCGFRLHIHGFYPGSTRLCGFLHTVRTE